MGVLQGAHDCCGVVVQGFGGSRLGGWVAQCGGLRVYAGVERLDGILQAWEGCLYDGVGGLAGFGGRVCG